MKKRIIIPLLLLIAGILFIISSILIKNGNYLNKKLVIYDDIIFTLTNSKKDKNSYKNTLVLKNNSYVAKKYDKLLLTFYDKNDQEIESQIIEIGKVYLNEDKKITFLSNNNLSNYKTFSINLYENNFININDSYTDGVITISNINVQNKIITMDIISNKNIIIEKLFIDLFDNNYNRLVSSENQLTLMKNKITSISIELESNEAIKYFDILEYNYFEIGNEEIHE